MTQMLLNRSRQFGEFLVERHVLSRDALEAAAQGGGGQRHDAARPADGAGVGVG